MRPAGLVKVFLFKIIVMEKIFLCYESECEIWVDDEDNENETVSIECHHPHSFKNNDELLKYLIQDKLEKNGQVFRFINEHLNDLVNIISEEVFCSEDCAETQNENFMTSDICQMMILRAKELAKSWKAQEKIEEKEFDIE
jgi:hypothetical protein